MGGNLGLALSMIAVEIWLPGRIDCFYRICLNIQNSFSHKEPEIQTIHRYNSVEPLNLLSVHTTLITLLPSQRSANVCGDLYMCVDICERASVAH